MPSRALPAPAARRGPSSGPASPAAPAASPPRTARRLTGAPHEIRPSPPMRPTSASIPRPALRRELTDLREVVARPHADDEVLDAGRLVGLELPDAVLGRARDGPPPHDLLGHRHLVVLPLEPARLLVRALDVVVDVHAE